MLVNGNVMTCRRNVVLFLYKVNYYIFFVLIDINYKMLKREKHYQWNELALNI